jgi:hypothetical protein
MLLKDMSAGVHHVTTTPAFITYNTRRFIQSMRESRLLVAHAGFQLLQICWLIEAVAHREGRLMECHKRAK